MIKKFLVIGNPIEHSLSPKLHNYWIKKNNIDAIYNKKKLMRMILKILFLKLKKKKSVVLMLPCHLKNQSFHF